MAWAADRLLRKREDGTSAMSRTNVRRVFNSISQVNELSSFLLSVPNLKDLLIELLFVTLEGPKKWQFFIGYPSVTLGRHSQRHQVPLQVRVSCVTLVGHLTVWLGIYFRGMQSPVAFFPHPQLAPAAALVLLCLTGCDVSAAVSLLCAGWFFNGALASAHMVSHVDLSPNFAGTLFGITNTFSGGATSFMV